MLIIFQSTTQLQLKEASLRLPISPQLDLEMGILGIATDFIDKSPPDDVEFPNRDAVGQSAFVETLG